MTNRKLGVLAIAAAAFSGACADPAGPSARTLELAAPSAALIPHALPPGSTLPSTNGLPKSDPNDGDGWVRLCKVSNTAGTFNFDVAVNGAVDGVGDVSITVAVGQEGTPVCHITPLHNSDLPAADVDIVNIVELDPGVNWATTVDIDQYYVVGVGYGPLALLDEWNVTPRTAKVYSNDDMEKVVTFNNDFTSTPDPEICDFITFGRLVTEIGGKKVVISGNAGGNNADASIKNEFHIDYLDVDYHVADATSYGPIAAGPLSLLTNSRVVTGVAKNGVTVELRVWDGGEPGKGTDIVWFSLNGVVKTAADGQFIDQGNMQYHSNCRGPGN